MTEDDEQSTLFGARDQAMDARLRSYAEAWRADEPPAPGEPLAPGRADRRPWLVPFAAAVVTIAAITGATLAVHATKSDPAPSGTSSAMPAVNVVPWRNLPATQPQLPATTVPAWPTAAELAAAPVCGASDLRLGDPGRIDGASGTLFFGASIYAVSSPCRLGPGYPEFSLLRGGRTLTVPMVDAHGFGGRRPYPVLIKKGAPAELWIDVPTHHCPAFSFDELRVRLPGVGVESRGRATFRAFCEPDMGSVAVVVEPIQSPHRRLAQTFSRFDSILALGPSRLTTVAGLPVRFEVTLVSPHDLPLVPCPDYAFDLGAGKQYAGLNCEGVRYRDKQGRPYLPANLPVRFDMELPGGKVHSGHFFWRLVTPRKTARVSGSLTVVGN